MTHRDFLVSAIECILSQEKKYILSMEGNLNSFLDVKPFKMGWGIPGHIQGDFSVSAIECIL